MQSPAEVLVDVHVQSASRDGARGQSLDDGQTGGAETQARTEVALSDASFRFVHDGPETGLCVCVCIYI